MTADAVHSKTGILVLMEHLFVVVPIVCEGFVFVQI